MPEKVVNSEVQRKQIATPAGNPPAGQFYEYYKADGKLYKKDSAGLETEVNAGGGGDKVTVSLKNGEAGAMVAGDVVIIDTTQDNACVFTTNSKDLKVVGVVVTGGASGAQVEICVDGIATVKVDSAVSRGDALVTSTTSQEAESGAGAVNAVLGKALTEKIGPGSGTVEAVINLA